MAQDESWFSMFILIVLAIIFWPLALFYLVVKGFDHVKQK